MPSQRLPPDDGAKNESQTQYYNAPIPMSKQDLDEKYPNRPINHNDTFYFRELITDLFDPLNDNKTSAGVKVNRRKQGPHHPSTSPFEIRRKVIERFISRWRKEVGDDFHPALRLICPDKDRDRPMYGLKEKVISKLLVKLMKIDKNSADAYNVTNWKMPARDSDQLGLGSFPQRAYIVLKKRAMITEPGNMRISEVNEMLDQLAAAQKEENQMPIFEKFYRKMNAEELTWLIKIILRQMKMGATEKTMLNLWHPDGEALYNVSSSLRRVCWELTNPEIRLGGEDTGIALMSPFQPQRAQFQDSKKSSTLEKIIDKMGLTTEESKKKPESQEQETSDKPEFWIEEKMDGERMQLHMIEDPNHPGGKRFAFWSRNAKDYTYLYGDGFKDDESALTRHIKGAFDQRVKNIVLDGEMVTWDPEMDKIVVFGTLKTAALSEKKNAYQQTGPRPLFRVFDCLYLNGQSLINYTLRNRRDALESAVKDVHRRLEKHHFDRATTADQVTHKLHEIIDNAGEGLVLKNPGSLYQLSGRVNTWMKVKPEYMMEHGEQFDCVVIGGYYGSGHRGGILSSYMCGLRVDQNYVDAGAAPMKFHSFFKVGGGFKREDYTKIKFLTEGKWHDWNPEKPPTEYIELAQGDKERPDVWIKPSDSVVLKVKASSVEVSPSFKTGYTLRFPRFLEFRSDKDWQSALTISEAYILKQKVENSDKKAFQVSTRRKTTKRIKKELVIAGTDSKIKNPYAGPDTEVFAGLDFCVLTDMTKPVKKSKAELEQMIKSNGGTLTQNPNSKENILIIADKRTVKPASIIKRGTTNLISGSWVLDTLKQAGIDGDERKRLLLPFEPRHMFHAIEASRAEMEETVDVYGDSYARDVEPGELGKLCEEMIHPKTGDFDPGLFRLQLEERGCGLNDMTGEFFRRCTLFFLPRGGDSDIDLLIKKSRVRFAGGRIAGDESEEGITHIVAGEGCQDVVKAVRRRMADAMLVDGKKIARIVGMKWVDECWEEKTLLDEERYTV